jgi:hypothetical protein
MGHFMAMMDLDNVEQQLLVMRLILVRSYNQLAS